MNDVVDKQGLGETEEGQRASSKLLWGLRATGVIMAALVWLLLGLADDLGSDARAVAAVATLMAVWWMTEAVPLPATSLLPIVLLPMLTGTTVSQATAPYASSLVFLFVGGFLIAIAMEKWGLHRRIALLVLDRVGVSPKRIILGMMIASGFLSMWVSNTATTLMMLPIGLSVLALVVESRADNQTAADLHEGLKKGTISDVVDDPNVKMFGVCLVLSIAWSATMGGLGTLLGSPPNLYRFDLDSIPGGKEMIRGEIAALGKMKQGEKMVAAVFGGAAFLWVVPGLLAGIPGLGFLDGLNDTAIAIGAGIALFLLPGRGRGEMVLNWNDAEDGLPWGVLLLFGGGLSLASSVASSGLDDWFGSQVGGLGNLPTILLIATIVLIVLFLTEITSNTATAATFIPVLGGVAVGIGVAPLSLLIPAAFAATCAFMLPVGTPPNAIVFGTGNVTIGQMMRGGVVLNVVGVMLITIVFYLLGGFVLGI